MAGTESHSRRRCLARREWRRSRQVDGTVPPEVNGPECPSGRCRAPATLQSSLACRLASEEQMLSGPAPQPRRVQTAPPIQEAPRFPPSSFLPALAYWISLTTQIQCSDSGEMPASDPLL